MKKRPILRAASLIVTLALLAGLVTSLTLASDAGRFDLDVIYVIDNSGSMLSADPNKLALSAANLFIDMCEDSDSRVGYVMFTHEIQAEQPLTDIQTFSEQLKQAISETSYNPVGNTDIALGLERAYELLERDALGGKSSRTPVVILLTDGNTDLPGGVPRTTQASLAALEEIKQKYAAEGLPIYSIGLNFDNRLDIVEVSKIAEATGAMSHEVSSADRLPAVLRGIYGHLTGSNSRNTTVIATGEPQSIPIPVDNDSIYKGTITISSVYPVRDVYLVDPDGVIYNEQGLSNKVSVNQDPLGNYTIFTMYRPAKGSWSLHFTGSKDDIILIDLMSIYDFVFVMEDPVTSVGEAKISWHLEDEYGTRVADRELIRGLLVTLHANDGDIEIAFPRGQQSENFVLPPGEYEAYLTMESDDIHESKRSNSRTFIIPDIDPIEPIRLFSPDNDVLEINLMTVFNTEAVVRVTDLVRFTADNEPLKISITSGEWSDIVDLQVDSRYEIYAAAIKSGNAETEVIVTGADGSAVTIYIDTSISSGLLYIIIAAAVLLLLIAAVIVLLIARKPYLDSSMRDFAIEVRNLPEMLEYPQAARLRLEHVKGKRSLQQTLYYNRQLANEYFEAFRDIGWFLSGTEFIAKRKDELTISIPVFPGYVVQVNGQNMPRPYVGPMRKNNELRIGLFRDEYNAYEIVLGENSFGQDGGWGGMPSPGAGGYAGYGGVSPGDFDLV